MENCNSFFLPCPRLNQYLNTKLNVKIYVPVSFTVKNIAWHLERINFINFLKNKLPDIKNLVE